MADEWLQRVGWSYPGGAEGASLLLGTVAGSMIAIAGTMFSMTLVALSLASSRMGPRRLRNFMRDTTNQVVLGTVVATFVYCLLVLRAIRRGGEAAFVPHLSVSVGVLLAIGSVGVLIYFIHHISVSIQADQVVARVGLELDEGIERLFPGTLGSAHSEVSTADGGATLPANFEREACPVGAARDGYLQLIDAETLVELACEVEIALRALSPGINDPFTAIACVDRLESALCRLARHDMPSSSRFGPDGTLRLVATGSTFEGIGDLAFNQIRQSAPAKPEVAIRMLDAIGQIAHQAHRAQDATCLQRHAHMILRAAQVSVLEEHDRMAVHAHFTQALQALHGLRG